MSELMVHLSIWQLLQLEVLFPEKIRGRESKRSKRGRWEHSDWQYWIVLSLKQDDLQQSYDPACLIRNNHAYDAWAISSTDYLSSNMAPNEKWLNYKVVDIIEI